MIITFITSANSSNINVPETIQNYSMSYGNMNVDEFVQPGIPVQECGGGYQQVTSRSSTPQNISSPAPSGASTPGMNPSSHNIGTPFSPVNYSTNSPRLSQSPMVGLPIPSPSGNGPQHSRPASTNSAMGAPPASPYGQGMPSPQVVTPSNQHTPQSHMASSPMSGMQVSPMTTPPAVQHAPYSSPGMTPPIAQSQLMIVSEIPSPVNRVSVNVNSRVTPPTKRSPKLYIPARAPAQPIINETRSVKQIPTIRGLHPIGQMQKLHPSKNPSFRIFELNRRLQDRHPQNESSWWDYFVCDFFDDSATLSLTLCLDDGSKNFTIRRPLIPRFFKSFFEGGAVELFFNLRHSKEWLQSNSIMVDSAQCAMETLYINPIYTKVISEGRLLLEFVPDEMMRIRSWHYTVRGWQEQIPRTVLSIQAQQPNPALIQQWSINITRQGFPATTLNYLKMCCILQPMQQLMTMHKTSGIDPRECLRKSLIQNWRTAEDKPMPIVPREVGRPAPKPRKKRKNAAEKGTTTNARKKRTTTAEMASALPVVDHAEVMVVGEPSMMGGALGKGDERHITRVENAQFAMEAFAQESGFNANTSWTLDDVLGSTDFDRNLHG